LRVAGAEGTWLTPHFRRYIVVGHHRRLGPGILILTVFLAGIPVSGQTTARPPYKIFDSKRGITAWTLPRSFQQIPNQPGEKLILGKFVKKGRKKESKRGRMPKFRPSYRYVLLGDVKAETKDVSSDTADPDPKPFRPQPTSPADFLKRYSFQFEITEKKLKKSTIAGRTVQEFHLTTKTGTPYAREPVEGMAVFFNNQGVYAGFLGFSSKNNFKNYRKTFRTLGYSIRFLDGKMKSKQTAVKKDPYEGSTLRGIDYRRKIRSAMVPGWKAIDTENYIIIHHSTDAKLLKKLDRNLEVMHAYFRKLYPPPKPVTAISTVRVCKNREEYIHYGGPAMSAGYWNHRSEELVLYDNKKGEYGSKLGNKDTFIVLYHEAFHQYVYHSAGELAPHIWFNEGNADYFSGAVIPGGKDVEVKTVRAHPWRYKVILQAVRTKKQVSLRTLFKMTKSEYYRNARLCYAQGWSVVYFLRTSSVVKKNPAWDKILSTYYRVLVEEYARLTEGLDKTPDPEDPDAKDPDAKDPDPEKAKELKKAKAEAGKKARSAATRAAFRGVDVDALEKAWKKFVRRKLRSPKV